MKTKNMVAALLVTLALGLSTTAEARPRWGRGPRVQISIGPRPYYYAPRPVYVAPRPVYYAPPPPVYYGPPPRAYYGRPYGYYRGRGHWRRW